jgi:hypothetical protein
VRWPWLPLALVLAACGGDEPADLTKTALLQFALSDDVRRDLTDPMRGAIYGSVFLSEDVSLTGPRNGAMSVADVDVAGADVRNTATSTAGWRSPALTPGTQYTFLGFWDTDANGATVKDPDPGDPVTLPTTNLFTVSADQETQVRVLFELIYN